MQEAKTKKKNLENKIEAKNEVSKKREKETKFLIDKKQRFSTMELRELIKNKFQPRKIDIDSEQITE